MVKYKFITKISNFFLRKLFHFWWYWSITTTLYCRSETNRFPPISTPLFRCAWLTKICPERREGVRRYFSRLFLEVFTTFFSLLCSHRRCLMPLSSRRCCHIIPTQKCLPARVGVFEGWWNCASWSDTQPGILTTFFRWAFYPWNLSKKSARRDTFLWNEKLFMVAFIMIFILVERWRRCCHLEFHSFSIQFSTLTGVGLKFQTDTFTTDSIRLARRDKVPWNSFWRTCSFSFFFCPTFPKFDCFAAQRGTHTHIAVEPRGGKCRYFGFWLTAGWYIF